MDPIERANYYRGKSSKRKKEIEEQTTEDGKINKRLFQIHQNQQWCKGQRQRLILMCQKMTAEIGQKLKNNRQAKLNGLQYLNV